MGCEAHNTISDAARPRWGGCSHGCCDNKGWENYEVAPRTAGALVGAPTVDQIGHLTAILVAESIDRSEEHTSELQSLMRISYAVFCLKKKTINTTTGTTTYTLRSTITQNRQNSHNEIH